MAAPLAAGRQLALLAVWGVSRLLLMLFVLRVLVFPGPDVTPDVSVIYHGWYEVLRSGTFPVDDVTWQYPPGAALAILSPALLPWLEYPTAFFVLSLVADAVVLALLLRAGRGRRARATGSGARSLRGAWVWAVGVPLLGPTVYARYDLMVTAVAVAALVAGVGRPRVFGALTAFGAMLKGWPVLLLLGAGPGRDWRRSWGAAAVTGAVLLAASVAAAPGSLDFLTAQRDRGTEVESVGGLVFQVGHHFGWSGGVWFHYGSMEFFGPGVAGVATASKVLSVLVLAWLVLWRLRARHWSPGTAADAAFTAVLLSTVTSRVISPQYLVWLVGLAAVCLVFADSWMGRPAWLVVAASLVTVVEFPVLFTDVVTSTPTGVALLLVRNGLLVWAAAAAAARLWRRTVTGQAEAVPAGEPASLRQEPLVDSP
ncbi:glycosyltransferase 87 family protein [Streptomyces sp. NPDC058045]|uniref:glycosyltransferase 87 family protein n=1 Tax=Streptomyces sp. NPDC058045 TaxID=3346311 RepID=UPI0036EA9CF8